MDFPAFVNGAKTVLVSPAGYGKTFTIAECLKHTKGRQLILTHTHAGISSIKEKIRAAGITPANYNVETISSFAQQFVHAFCKKALIPPQDKSREYHEFVINKAIALFSSSLAITVIRSSYKGLFVDEYQDCSEGQHILIQQLSCILPTHIVGDPLQGIFDFNGKQVDMDNDLPGFTRFPDLETPYRWYRDGNNKNLGDKIKEYRELLLQKRPLALATESAADLFIIEIKESDIYKPQSVYRKKLDSIIYNKKNLPGMESLLLIVPEYDEVVNGRKVMKGNIAQRAKLKQTIDYAQKLVLLEAIDDRLFYSLAADADGLLTSIGRAKKKYKKIREVILDHLFPVTPLNDWFNEKSLKIKTGKADKVISEEIARLMDNFIQSPSAYNLCQIVLLFRKELKIKYKREEIGRSFVASLKQSHLNNTSIHESIKDNRNLLRRTGRKVHGKCIGTTLLTKGLEFDTVVLINAHRFDSSKHLYVALTRCCKRLVIFTENKMLTPY